MEPLASSEKINVGRVGWGREKITANAPPTAGLDATKSGYSTPGLTTLTHTLICFSRACPGHRHQRKRLNDLSVLFWVQNQESEAKSRLRKKMRALRVDLREGGGRLGM